MESFHKLMVTLIISVVISLTVVAVCTSLYNYNVTKIAIENGYERSTLPGHVGVAWVKSK